jgi:hypothetical protein
VFSRPSSLILTAVLVGLVTTNVMAGSADWFSQNGLTVQEAVGTPELGFVLVGTDEGGAFKLLSKGDQFKGVTIDNIGSEQVKIQTADKGSVVVPILHRNLPPDVFLAAMATVFQKSIVIGTHLDTLKPFTTELLTDPNKLADFCKGEGLDLRVFDDCLVVRKGLFPPDLKAFSSTEPQTTASLTVVRGSAAEIIEAVSKAASLKMTSASAAANKITVRSFGLSAQAMAYYLSKVTDVAFKVEEPKPEPSAAPSPTAKAPAGKFKDLMKAGNFRGAALVAKAAIKKNPKNAAYYNAFGLAVWKMGNQPLAIRAWQKALRIDPANTYAQNILRKAKSQQPGVDGPAAAGQAGALGAPVNLLNTPTGTGAH